MFVNQSFRNQQLTKYVWGDNLEINLKNEIYTV